MVSLARGGDVFGALVGGGGDAEAWVVLLEPGLLGDECGVVAVIPGVGVLVFLYRGVIYEVQV